jgi:acetate---CoA ligase (ADP-forming)
MNDTHQLGRLFRPETVAIVGATDNPVRPGGRLVRYMTENGFAGRLYFVNPRRDSLLGQPCHPSVDALPEEIDLLLLAISGDQVPAVLADAGARGVGAAVVFASNSTAHPDYASFQRSLRDARADYPMRVLGPNTAGLRSTHLRLFAEQGTNLMSASFLNGSTAFISQSGGLGSYFGSTYLQRLGVGTRYYVDTGNEIDIDAADCLNFISADPAVSAVGMVLESCRDGRKLAAAVALARERNKAVFFLKVGRSAAGMQAALSHTAALASQTELLESEIADAGGLVTRDERQMEDGLLLHATGNVPPGRRLGVVTPSGGFGVLALDLASELGLEVPDVEPAIEADTRRRLNLGGSNNPLEMAGPYEQETERLATSLDYLASKDRVDAIVLWQPHRYLIPAEQQTHLPILAASRRKSGKPHYHCGMLPSSVAEGWRQEGLLSFESPSRLMVAIELVTRGGTDGVRRTEPSADPVGDGVSLDGEAARARLASTEITINPTVAVVDLAHALSLQREWQSDVIMKVESPNIAHKSDHGLVVGPLGEAEIGAAFQALTSSDAMIHDREARLVLQPFVRGIELALGAYRDPSFGPCVMVAQGGTLLELVGDTSFAAAPIDRDKARCMIERLRIGPAFCGYRGLHMDLDAVLSAIVSLSRFIAAPENADLAAVDVNPYIVLASGRGAVAVDLQVVVAPSAG